MHKWAFLYKKKADDYKNLQRLFQENFMEVPKKTNTVQYTCNRPILFTIYIVNTEKIQI